MKRIFLFCTAVATAPAAWSQEALPDPTRPPAGWATGQAGAAAGEGGALLQSVVLPRQGRPAAFINGERVELGGKYGEMKVVKITESEVVLKGAAGEQTLKMVPEVEKRMRPVAGKKNKANRENKP